MARVIPLTQPKTESCETKPHVHPADIIRELEIKAIEKARVLFINMPLRESARPTNTPEGPLLMATRLRDNFGVDASIIDLNAYRIKDKLWEERTAKGENLPWGRHKTLQEAQDQ